MSENQSIIGKDVLFKGKITNSKTIEIHGRVEADIKSEILVLSPEDVFLKEQENKRIVLIDEGGGRNGISAIDAILKNNLITIVSTDFLIGEMINPNLRTPIYKKFLAQGVKFIPCCKLARLLKNDVVIKNIYSRCSHQSVTVFNTKTIQRPCS